MVAAVAMARTPTGIWQEAAVGKPATESGLNGDGGGNVADLGGSSAGYAPELQGCYHLVGH